MIVKRRGELTAHCDLDEPNPATVLRMRFLPDAHNFVFTCYHDWRMRWVWYYVKVLVPIFTLFSFGTPISQ